MAGGSSRLKPDGQAPKRGVQIPSGLGERGKPARDAAAVLEGSERHALDEGKRFQLGSAALADPVSSARAISDSATKSWPSPSCSSRPSCRSA